MGVLYIILGIIVFLIVLTVIVVLHEGGHFFFSRKAGILCHEFSVGMGPLIASKKKGETVYSIRAIPLGGYVSMAGEEADADFLKGAKQLKIETNSDGIVTKIILILDNPKYKDLPVYDIVGYDLVGSEKILPDELYLDLKDSEGNVNHYIVARDAMINYVKKEEIQIAPYDRTFTNKPIGKRFMSVFAGPMMNFILAIVVFFAMGIIFGYADNSSTITGGVSGPAADSGMVAGDAITEINGNKLTTWDDLSNAMHEVTLGNGIAADGSISIVYTHSSSSVTVEKIYPEIIILTMDAQIAYSEEKGVYFVDFDNFSDTLISKSGVKANDSITKMNGVAITGIDVFLKTLAARSDDDNKLSLEVMRDGAPLQINANVYTNNDLKASNYEPVRVLLGVESRTKFDLVKCLYMPFVQTGESSIQIIRTLRQLFKRKSGINISSLSGAVGISKLFVQIVQSDQAFYNVLYWTGLLSVNIGVINLLPLPALDGGRLAFIIYEAITKKRPTPKVENTIHNIGFILLIALFIFICISDIIKIF